MSDGHDIFDTEFNVTLVPVGEAPEGCEFDPIEA